MTTGTWIWIALGAVSVVGFAIALLRRRARGGGGGPVGIVLLRKTPRPFTEADIRSLFRRTLKVEVAVQTISPDEFSTGYIATCEQLPPIVVITSTRTYMEPGNVADVAARSGHAATREAILAHTAWVAVDAIGLKKTPPFEGRKRIYNELLGKVAADLLDDQCVLLYLVAEQRLGLINSDTASKLANGAVLDVFADDEVQAPIIRVEPGDAALEHAIQTAKDRLPDFTSYLQRRHADAKALVKGKFTDAEGEIEYMWVEVASTDGNSFTGELLNSAASKSLPKQGSQVTVPADDVVDWLYIDENENQIGGFAEEVLRSRM